MSGWHALSPKRRAWRTAIDCRNSRSTGAVESQSQKPKGVSEYQFATPFVQDSGRATPPCTATCLNLRAMQRFSLPPTEFTSVEAVILH
jgi:hypothetical protein